MSDDNKDLSDDLEDMIGDAKEGAKKAGDKISQKASELADDAKEVLSDGKNIGVIAHITFIGWIIALVMNSSNKTEFGSFYIRQMLGLLIIAIITVWIPFLNLVMWLVLLVAWIMSLVAALGGEMKPTFLLGKQFQEWFKSL